MTDFLYCGPFPETTQGCVLAEQYLRATGQYEHFERTEQSTDGWTLVAYANVVAKRALLGKL